MKITVCLGILILLVALNTANAQALKLRCVYDGGAVQFSVAVNGVQATVTNNQANIPRNSISGIPTATSRAFLVRGKGSLGDWRDLYVIEAAEPEHWYGNRVSLPGAVFRFSHVHEDYPDGLEKVPAMVVQAGICRAVE